MNSAIFAPGDKTLVMGDYFEPLKDNPDRSTAAAL